MTQPRTLFSRVKHHNAIRELYGGVFGAEVVYGTRSFSSHTAYSFWFVLGNKGETISREQLLESVWGMDFDPGSNIVNVYIRSLRRKIGEAMIETRRGEGYVLRST